MTENSQRLITFKKAYWRARERLGLPAVSNFEIHYRLRRRPLETSFQFPWGKLQASNFGQVASQFDEIFIRRQYAFSTDVSEPVIIDCGGNVGLSAIWFKQNYPNCHLTVFEADPKLAELIAGNLERAHLKNVVVRNEVVWIAEGIIAFDAKGDDSGKVTKEGKSSLRSIDLATSLPDTVDLLKMDIEGAEFSVLKKLCETAAINKVKLLICEFHLWREKTDEFIEVLSLLRSSGMQFSMVATVDDSLGTASNKSPLERVGLNQGLLELFAWHEKI